MSFVNSDGFSLGPCSLLGGENNACSSLSAIEPDLIYTDILGLGQIQKAVLNGWIKHKYVLLNWSGSKQKILLQLRI